MVRVKVKDTEAGTIRANGDFIVGVVASEVGGGTVEGGTIIAGNASPIALADVLARLVVDTAESIDFDKEEVGEFIGVFCSILAVQLLERGYDDHRSAEEG